MFRNINVMVGSNYAGNCKVYRRRLRMAHTGFRVGFLWSRLVWTRTAGIKLTLQIARSHRVLDDDGISFCFACDPKPHFRETTLVRPVAAVQTATAKR